MNELNLQKIFGEEFDITLKYWMETVEYKKQLINFIKTTLSQEKYLESSSFRISVVKSLKGFYLDKNRTYFYSDGEIYEICGGWDSIYAKKLKPQDFDEGKIESIVRKMAELKAYKFAHE